MKAAQLLTNLFWLMLIGASFVTAEERPTAEPLRVAFHGSFYGSTAPALQSRATEDAEKEDEDGSEEKDPREGLPHERGSTVCPVS